VEDAGRGPANPKSEIRNPKSEIPPVILTPGGFVFGTLGMPELILIFVVALLLFGPRKMPQIGRSIGRAMGEFRRASNEFKRTIEDEVAADEIREVEKDLKEIKKTITDPVGISDLKTSIKDSLEQSAEPAADTEGTD
jgi:TatA/E family protein of Tat protein translocase